jgi:uncharacterized protein YerC
MELSAPPRSDFHVDIGQSELDFYGENGYLAFDQMTTADELEWLTEVYDSLKRRAAAMVRDQRRYRLIRSHSGLLPVATPKAA